MSRNLWKSAVLCCALLSPATLPLLAQNATSGGDQQPQDDAQTSAQRRGPGGPGGQRRGTGLRGTVTAVSGTSVTIKDESGTTWTVITTDNTRVMRSQQVTPIGSVQAGDELIAMGLPDAEKHELHAVVVMDVSAADVAKARADMGRTYIIGRVVSIDDTKVTVMRTDKISQTINLDETTSLHKGGRMNPDAMRAMGVDAGMMGGGMGMGGGGRRGGQGAGAPPAGAPPVEGGEAITLADVKVGDSIVGIGSIKGGVFVPTDLRVQDRPFGQRRGPGGPAGAPPQ
ncbi:hypothetical protein Terro_0276 [Terriglobus roseus DSM 18391]|uniref:DUF5666 domain-containing protein n=1 Tax=Terriglobus roseus (strain DSM 18391 / NRRL B-41598 / KBS 63) TaxID=926566 RepID=I3ZBK7_TERRK|nr:hypothetical protein [Terriglobus roseus]AFL86625.1 hypothetical protein Terro_0276 [Terriglobus roseus DSM 18391]